MQKCEDCKFAYKRYGEEPRAPRKAHASWLSFSHLRLSAHASGRVISQPQRVFRPQALFIQSSQIEDLRIENVQVGQETIFLQSAPLPAVLFKEPKGITELKEENEFPDNIRLVDFPTCSVGNMVTIHFANYGEQIADIGCAMWGYTLKLPDPYAEELERCLKGVKPEEELEETAEPIGGTRSVPLKQHTELRLERDTLVKEKAEIEKLLSVRTERLHKAIERRKELLRSESIMSDIIRARDREIQALKEKDGPEIKTLHRLLHETQAELHSYKKRFLGTAEPYESSVVSTPTWEE